MIRLATSLGLFEYTGASDIWGTFSGVLIIRGSYYLVSIHDIWGYLIRVLSIRGSYHLGCISGAPLSP